MKGKDLPRYVVRHKRTGKLLFQRRGWPQKTLETQFPEGEAVPFALHQEVQRILSAPARERFTQDELETCIKVAKEYGAVIKIENGGIFLLASPKPHHDCQTDLYRIFNEKGDLLYVGISRQTHIRLEQHSREKPFMFDAVRATVCSYPNRHLAEYAEDCAIWDEGPAFNRKRPNAKPSEPTYSPIYRSYCAEMGGSFEPIKTQHWVKRHSRQWDVEQ